MGGAWGRRGGDGVRNTSGARVKEGHGHLDTTSSTLHPHRSSLITLQLVAS